MSITPEQEARSRDLYLKKLNIVRYECCICYGLLRSKLSCDHVVCETCLVQLDSLQCPVCRHRLSPDEIGAGTTSVIMDNQLRKEEYLKMKDRAASLYISMYPNVNMDHLYSALNYFEEPMLILDLTPKQLKQFVK